MRCEHNFGNASETFDHHDGTSAFLFSLSWMVVFTVLAPRNTREFSSADCIAILIWKRTFHHVACCQTVNISFSVPVLEGTTSLMTPNIWLSSEFFNMFFTDYFLPTETRGLRLCLSWHHGTFHPCANPYTAKVALSHISVIGWKRSVFVSQPPELLGLADSIQIDLMR